MSSEPPIPSKPPAFDWRQHLGLCIGAGATALICLKLLAVAGWDSTTAFGILAASGTANVLTGTLLAVLPPLYGAIVFAVLPRVERHLKRRSSVERSAARLLETWPVILLSFIAPVGLLLAIAAFVIFMVALSLIRHLRERRSSKKDQPQRTTDTENDAPSRFEAVSAGLGGLAMLAFWSLATPWVPPESISTSNGAQTAYVLEIENDTATVLMADNRRLLRVPSDAATGEYCSLDLGWWTEPILQVFTKDKYPNCPE